MIVPGSGRGIGSDGRHCDDRREGRPATRAHPVQRAPAAIVVRRHDRRRRPSRLRHRVRRLVRCGSLDRPALERPGVALPDDHSRVGSTSRAFASHSAALLVVRYLSYLAHARWDRARRRQETLRARSFENGYEGWIQRRVAAGDLANPPSAADARAAAVHEPRFDPSCAACGRSRTRHHRTRCRSSLASVNPESVASTPFMPISRSRIRRRWRPASRADIAARLLRVARRSRRRESGDHVSAPAACDQRHAPVHRPEARSAPLVKCSRRRARRRRTVDFRGIQSWRSARERTRCSRHGRSARPSSHEG